MFLVIIVFKHYTLRKQCVRQRRPVSKMAAITKNRNFFKWPKLLSQKVPKFELYKHNHELFNIYYRIFYEFWTFADFGRLCKLEKRGDEIKKKIFSSETTEPISTKLCWNDSWVVLFQNCVRHFRTPTKMATTAELNLT
jgi:hypothetical protein